MPTQSPVELEGVPQLGDIYDGYGRVHDAVKAVLAHYGRSADQISQEQALNVLLGRSWRDLPTRELAAAQRRFPVVIAPASADDDSRDEPEVRPRIAAAQRRETARPGCGAEPSCGMPVHGSPCGLPAGHFGAHVPGSEPLCGRLSDIWDREFCGKLARHAGSCAVLCEPDDGNPDPVYWPMAPTSTKRYDQDCASVVRKAASPAEHAAEALAVIAGSGLPGEVRLQLAAHVGELVDQHDAWLLNVVSGWISREWRLFHDREPADLPPHEGFAIWGRQR